MLRFSPKNDRSARSSAGLVVAADADRGALQRRQPVALAQLGERETALGDVVLRHLTEHLGSAPAEEGVEDVTAQRLEGVVVRHEEGEGAGRRVVERGLEPDLGQGRAEPRRLGRNPEVLPQRERLEERAEQEVEDAVGGADIAYEEALAVDVSEVVHEREVERRGGLRGHGSDGEEGIEGERLVEAHDVVVHHLPQDVGVAR